MKLEQITNKITLYNGDNMEGMLRYPDGYFDLAIVDPPYFSGPNISGYYGKGYSNLGVKRAKYYKEAKHWEVPGKAYFDELFRVSKHQIIWGANHFAGSFNSSSSCWIIWDKLNGASSFSDAEMAYTSFKSGVRIFKYMWNGMHQGSFGGNVKLNEIRIHPTQKPIKLYDWLLHNYAKPDFKILDTHLGSMSIAIACHYFGCELTGFEIDPEYYEAGIKRVKQQIRQTTIFQVLSA